MTTSGRAGRHRPRDRLSADGKPETLAAQCAHASGRGAQPAARSFVENGGMVSPIIVDERREIIAGHGRLLAAKKLGVATVPVIALRGLSDIQSAS